MSLSDKMDIGDIYWANVVSTKDFGAFLSWNNKSDILLPNNEQLGDIDPEERYLVIVCYDNINKRYYASEKIDHYLKEIADEGKFKKGQLIEGVVYAYSPIGIKVAINKEYIGLLYKNEVYRKLRFGDKIKAYIKNIREDGKLDLSINKPGYEGSIKDSTEKILQELKNSKGFLPYTDKSTPDEIYKKFEISKKNFKQAIGSLYKQRKIIITDKGISAA